MTATWRRRSRRFGAAIGVMALALVATSCYRVDGSTVLDASDAPDPTAVRLADGRLVVLTTQANGFRIQRMTFDAGGQLLERAEALGSIAPWMSGSNIWAPEVAPLGSGWVLYFAADTIGPGRSERCIGIARSGTVEGPFVPDAEPAVCTADPDDELIDPSVYDAPDGVRWLLLRRGDERWTRHVILSMSLDPASGRPNSWPSVLVDGADAWPASRIGRIGRIENPQMFHDPRNGVLILLVSAGNWMDGSYRTISFACVSPQSCRRVRRGDTTKVYRPVLQSSPGLAGPGGMSIVRQEGVLRTSLPAEVVFHAVIDRSAPIRRSLRIGRLTPT